MSASARTSLFASPLVGATAAAIIGVVVVMLMTVFGDHTRNADPVSKSTPKAAQAFINAWSKERTGTWYLESTFSRTLGDGRSYTATSKRAQRGDNSVTIAGGSTTISRDGERRVCTGSVQGAAPTCRDVGAFSAPAERTSHLATIINAVRGTSASYQVARRKDACFELQPLSGVAANNAPDWGTAAEFCFDQPTGALISSRIVRIGAMDVTTATTLRATVTDADFDRLASAH